MTAASLITAIAGALTAALGVYLGVRGRQDQNRQQSAANAALADKGRLEETQQALDALRDALQEERATTAGLRDRNDLLRTQRDKAEEDLDEERELRRQLLAQQEARCREQTVLLTDALVTLRSVVVDETAKSAAATVLDRRLPHPHTPPELGAGES